eukprot:433388-Alexandrium_andersonii.AAC.1
MSASLVGSEMCIRDRRRTRRRQEAFIGVWGSTEGGACAGASRRPCASGCLLYTSDAADDM